TDTGFFLSPSRTRARQGPSPQKNSSAAQAPLASERPQYIYFFLAADSTSFNMRSRAWWSNRRPLAITAEILSVLRLFSRGLAVQRTRSAILPGSIEP